MSLLPYTLYTVQVQAANFYSESPTTLSLDNVDYYKTKPGSQYCQLLNKVTVYMVVLSAIFSSGSLTSFALLDARRILWLTHSNRGYKLGRTLNI